MKKEHSCHHCGNYTADYYVYHDGDGYWCLCEVCAKLPMYGGTKGD